MKGLLRRFIISLGALWFTSRLLPSLVINGGISGLLVAALGFMVAEIILIPLIRILLLPLNLLTLGIFAWLTNVLALFVLVSVMPNFYVLPYYFPGANLGMVILPAMNLSVFQVVVVASLLIGGIIHLTAWLIK